MIFESEGLRLSWSEVELDRTPLGLSGGVNTFVTFNDDEHIYKLDHGEAFAGESYMGYFLNEFNVLGNPAQDKRYRNIFLEFKAKTAQEITLMYALDYASSEYSKTFTAAPTELQGTGYGISSYDDAYFDMAPMERVKISLFGTGFNFRAGLKIESAFLPSLIFYGYILRYDQRGNV
jgi:hypothetical protein